MRVLGLVTARGGSKGFPGKNLATIAGRPLVTWAHRALSLLRERHPELVIHLSTDSAAIAAEWPAEDRPRRLRPAELARDDSTSMDVVDYEVAQMAAEGRPCDAVLLLQPTSPLTTVDDLEMAWTCYVAGSPSITGIAEVTHPVQWSFYRRDDGTIDPVLEFREARRQEFRQAFLPVGFYMASVDFLRKHRAFSVAGVSKSVVVTEASAMDIDHQVDLDLAVALQRRMSGERPFTLGARTVGDGSPCYIIAEAGVNHNGDATHALALVRAAADAGADAVKFQTFRAETLVSAGARTAAYQQAQTGDTDQVRLLKRLELPIDALRACRDEARRLGLAFLSTPFDEASADLLAELDVPGFKIGSGELTNLPLLRHVAGLGRPLMISTGMSTLDEVEDAARAIRRHGDPPTAWLHCVSSYPTPPAEANLKAIDSLRLILGGPVGWSDHTPGVEVALAAVARGAQIIEKHLTLDRSQAGPDHAVSLEPHDFARMVAQIRLVESALGDGIKRPAPCERDTAEVARRSLVATRTLPVGHVLVASDLVVKRPGTGISPRDLERVLGRRLAQPVSADVVLTWNHLT